MKFLSIICVLIFSAVAVFPQKTAKSVYKIRFDDHHLSLKYRQKNYPLALRDSIDAAKITEAELLFADKKGAFTYLVVDVGGQSKSKPDDRQCGAGIEANLIWIKLNAKMKVADFKSERYESCWAGITSVDGYKIEGKTLKITFDNFRENTTTNLLYNSVEPDKGFQIETKKLEQTR